MLALLESSVHVSRKAGAMRSAVWSTSRWRRRWAGAQ